MLCLPGDLSVSLFLDSTSFLFPMFQCLVFPTIHYDYDFTGNIVLDINLPPKH